MKTRKVIAALVLAALLFPGCAKKQVKQYTIEQFLNTTAIRGGSFSHDDERILFSSDRSGIFNAYMMPADGGEWTQMTESADNSIFTLSFFPGDDRFLYMSDRGGNEIYHVYLRNLDGSVEDLTPEENARSVFYGWTHDRKSFLLGSNKRNPKYMDVYEMDLGSLEPNMIYLNDAGFDFGGISNDKRYIALSKTITTHNSEMYIYDRETGEVKHVSPHEGDVSYSPVGFSVDSGKMYFLTDGGREFTYLKACDIETGKMETVETADWDISYSYFSYNGTYRVTAINNDARTEIRVCETATGKLVRLPKMPEAVITSVGISRSEKLMTFYVNGSRSPNDLYVYDFETGKYRKLTDSMNPGIDQNDLVDAEVVRYESFDGLEIPSVYYSPKHVEKGDNVPALVWVHGGPGGQARVGYSSLIQYLVNHGYAVILVNNRGSSGYGKTFFKLDDMKHGEDDLYDCIEAKKFLAETGYIDTDKIGIIGGSYGGYMVLAALTYRPEEFAVGVDLFGISNWLRTLKNIPPWWEAFRKALYIEMGNPETDEEYLRRISPLFHAKNIVRPLMVLQGANDPRVLKAESDEIVEAARKNNAPVEYMVFDDEGHGFMKKENRIKGYRAILEFLDEHLKGRSKAEV